MRFLGFFWGVSTTWRGAVPGVGVRARAGMKEFSGGLRRGFQPNEGQREEEEASTRTEKLIRLLQTMLEI